MSNALTPDRSTVSGPVKLLLSTISVSVPVTRERSNGSSHDGLFSTEVRIVTSAENNKAASRSAGLGWCSTA